MLLVDDGEAEIGEDHAVLEERMRADDDMNRPRRQRRQGFAALRGLVAAGHQRHAQAGLPGERRHPVEMLARQNLGRRHHRRLPANLDHVGHGEQRDDGLARADVALQQPDHALFGAQVRADVGQRLLLRACQRKRQRRLEPAPSSPRRRGRARSFRAARPTSSRASWFDRSSS